MNKFEAMKARAQKAGLWPMSVEQAYYAGLEDGAQKTGELERENRELRAHFERLQSIRSKALRQYRHNNDNSASLFEPEYGFVCAYDAGFVDSLLSETPAQSLRSIQAEAVESLRFPRMLRKMWSGGEVQQWLDDQAQQLRNGEDNE